MVFLRYLQGFPSFRLILLEFSHFPLIFSTFFHLPMDLPRVFLKLTGPSRLARGAAAWSLVDRPLGLRQRAAGADAAEDGAQVAAAPVLGIPGYADTYGI